MKYTKPIAGGIPILKFSQSIFYLLAQVLIHTVDNSPRLVVAICSILLWFVYHSSTRNVLFSLILQFLHLNNSKYVKKGQPGYDPLFKLWPFLDPLLKRFKKKAYHRGREVSIDESMIGFKVRLSFL